MEMLKERKEGREREERGGRGWEGERKRREGGCGGKQEQGMVWYTMLQCFLFTDLLPAAIAFLVLVFVVCFTTFHCPYKAGSWVLQILFGVSEQVWFSEVPSLPFDRCHF